MTTNPNPTDALLHQLLLPGQYGVPSELRKAVELRVDKLAGEIADEVIARHPELRGLIVRYVQQTVSSALREDSYLKDVVIQSVARGLGKLVTEAEAMRDDRD